MHHRLFLSVERGEVRSMVQVGIWVVKQCGQKGSQALTRGLKQDLNVLDLRFLFRVNFTVMLGESRLLSVYVFQLLVPLLMESAQEN